MTERAKRAAKVLERLGWNVYLDYHKGVICTGCSKICESGYSFCKDCGTKLPDDPSEDKTLLELELAIQAALEEAPLKQQQVLANTNYRGSVTSTGQHLNSQVPAKVYSKEEIKKACYTFEPFVAWDTDNECPRVFVEDGKTEVSLDRCFNIEHLKMLVQVLEEHMRKSTVNQ